MLFMNLREEHGSIRSWRAISIVDARMDAGIAMPLLACGQPGKNGMQWLNLERIF
jgi:hypothetical protein